MLYPGVLWALLDHALGDRLHVPLRPGRLRRPRRRRPRGDRRRALYADMGHVSRDSVHQGLRLRRRASLILVYMGQGRPGNSPIRCTATAILLPDGRPALPKPVLIVFATLATVIASQAVISSTFSP